MPDFTDKVAEIRAQLQSANINQSSRVFAKFDVSDGNQDYLMPVQILPVSGSSNPNLSGANLIDFVMNQIDQNFLRLSKAPLRVRDVQVDTQ